MIIKGTFQQRLRAGVSFAWSIYMEKVASGLLQINKEASMQLQYSLILSQIIPLICFNDSEKATIELEKGVNVSNRRREIDLLLKGTNENSSYNIAVEMKCYRDITSSGGKRGATDIFMKDVYEDLQLLESYCTNDSVDPGVDAGVGLVMNDLGRLVNPKQKTAKCWAYDISQGAKTSLTPLTTPIGGKDVNIALNQSYTFNWIRKGNFWFVELEGE
jgi:hypothetical protein